MSYKPEMLLKLENKSSIGYLSLTQTQIYLVLKSASLKKDGKRMQHKDGQKTRTNPVNSAKDTPPGTRFLKIRATTEI